MELISREEVLNLLNEICIHALKLYDEKYHLPIRTMTSTAVEDIKKLPSQWVEINEPPFGKVYQNSFVTFLSTETYDEVRRRLHRPKGKWEHEFHSYDDGLGWRWRCSNCGCVIEDTIRGKNYCFNCGADMGGTNDDTV